MTRWDGVAGRRARRSSGLHALFTFRVHPVIVMSMPIWAMMLVPAVNLATVYLFAIDKARAVAGGWRVRESTLLGMAAIGGSPGALWARRRFRHKTRKQPFATQLDLIAMTQAGLAMGLLVVLWR